jgi:hypothetical protein
LVPRGVKVGVISFVGAIVVEAVSDVAAVGTGEVGMRVGGGGRIGSVAVGAGVVGWGVTVGDWKVAVQVGCRRADPLPCHNLLIPTSTRATPETNKSSAKAVDHRGAACCFMQGYAFGEG